MTAVGSVAVHDERFAAVARGSGPVRRLWSGAQWSEGPVWIRESGMLLWSDIPADRILCWSAERGGAVWRQGVDFTNGHVREPDGGLLHCSHGRRAILRTRLDASGRPIGEEVVVDRYQGRRLNSPNDVVVKRDGTIWFTDPPYGIVSDREGHRAPSELGDCYVFRFDPRDGALRIVSDFVEEPNGLAFSPDESVLYVSDTSAALRGDGTGHHHIVAFDVGAAGDLSNPRVLAEVSPGLADGFRVDIHGFLYSSSADGVQVLHPDGTRIGHIPVPETVANVCFGGEHGDLLFMCATTSLYAVKLGTRGATT
jgi:gluconolactonase